MGLIALENAILLDPEAAGPEPGGLLVEEGRIAAVRSPSDEAPPSARRIDLQGRELAPGFLDVHFHGPLVFAEAERYDAALQETAASLLRHGVTGFLATTVAWEREDLRERTAALARAVGEFRHEAAQPLGIHLEGPWIRPEAAGAQPRKGIRPYEAGEGEALLDCSQGQVRMVTLAPEADGAGALLAELGRRGIVAALGHSLAGSECIEDAVSAGARHVTHLYNAMGPLHHREPGMVGTALADDRLSCDLICDGVHVHPSAVRLAARAKGPRLMLITDRVEPHAGGFGSGAVTDDGTALRLADGRLAGSSLHMDRAVANAQGFGAMTRHEAVAAATFRPARLLGLESELGSLRPGARADLVELGRDGVVATWLAGSRIEVR